MRDLYRDLIDMTEGTLSVKGRQIFRDGCILSPKAELCFEGLKTTRSPSGCAGVRERKEAQS